jgi:hypothetical protein
MELRSRYQLLDTKRRVALDKLLDIKGITKIIISFFLLLWN